jgi:hypothetical protein
MQSLSLLIVELVQGSEMLGVADVEREPHVGDRHARCCLLVAQGAGCARPRGTLRSCPVL